jgi:chromosome segregation ATPase
MSDREYFDAVMRERDERYAQHFEMLRQLCEAQQRELQSALASLDRQIQRSEETTERRFDAVNTARRVGDDAARLMMPRSEAVQRDQALDDKIQALAARLDRSDGRSRGLNAGWAYLIAAIGMLASIVTAVYAISRLATTAGP